MNTATTKEKSNKSKVYAVLALVLTKGKVLLGALLKLKGVGTFVSMVISTFAYWWAWNLGIWGAVGFVASIWLHEMGHVTGARIIGLPVSAPVFIPFLGALIRMKQSPTNARDEAIMAMAGPLAGALAAFACLGIWALTDAKIWLWLATIGMLINLFNLIPVMPLDGGRIATLFGRGFWWLGLATLVGLSFVMQNAMLIVFAYLGLEEINQRFTRLPRWVLFVPAALAVGLGIYADNPVEALLLGSILLLFASLRVRFERNQLQIIEPQQDAAFFNVGFRDKALILTVYLSMIGGLGVTYWWLHGLAATVV